MIAVMIQAGERFLVDCRPRWLSRIISEACGSALRAGVDDNPDIHLVITDEATPFELAGWDPLTRGAFHRDGNLVLINACGSGFDLRFILSPNGAHAKVRIDARFRPPARDRLASYALRSRFHLLTRAVLMQYPALWAAGTRGRMPLHAAALQTDDEVMLLAGPGGVGRSTMLLQALGLSEAAGGNGRACSDNLSVSDGQVVHGLVEPVRIEGAGGRRMPHGRGERELPNRTPVLTPDRVVVLRRASAGAPMVRPITAARAGNVLTAGTYMAGELRRYWAFAATLALATGRGPACPRVNEVCASFARLPAVEITLGDRPCPSLVELLAAREPVAL